ncbi:hypothetical protein FRB97_001313 [Tulasnella sp. 331]|nr:hypothetical protein FRB97_001313 [Tulasnella sp. 331]
MTSYTHEKSPLVDWTSFDWWNMKWRGFSPGLQSYTTSKTVNILFTKELQRRLDEQNAPALSITVHPKDAATDASLQNLRDTLPRVVAGLILAIAPFFVNKPPQSAYTPVFATTSHIVKSKRKEFSGLSLLPVGIISENRVSAAAKAPTAAQDL